MRRPIARRNTICPKIPHTLTLAQFTATIVVYLVTIVTCLCSDVQEKGMITWPSALTLSLSLPLSPTLSLSLFLFVYAFMYICICVAYLCIYVSIYLFVYLCLSLSLTISLSVYQSISLTIYLFISCGWLSPPSSRNEGIIKCLRLGEDAVTLLSLSPLRLVYLCNCLEMYVYACASVFGCEWFIVWG